MVAWHHGTLCICYQTDAALRRIITLQSDVFYGLLGAWDRCVITQKGNLSEGYK